MTEQVIMDKVNSMLALYNASNYLMLHNELTKLHDNLKEDIERQEAKKNGQANIRKAFKFIVDNAKRVCSVRPLLHQVINDKGLHVATDGHQIIVSTVPCGIEAVPKPEGYINYERVVDDARAKSERLLKIPSKIELKDIISQAKANVKAKTSTSLEAIYLFDECELCGIDARYLLNAIEAGITQLRYDNKYMFIGTNDDNSLTYVICGIRK